MIYVYDASDSLQGIRLDDIEFYISSDAVCDMCKRTDIMCDNQCAIYFNSWPFTEVTKEFYVPPRPTIPLMYNWVRRQIGAVV